jgi:hypothetical protein
MSALLPPPPLLLLLIMVMMALILKMTARTGTEMRVQARQLTKRGQLWGCGGCADTCFSFQLPKMPAPLRRRRAMHISCLAMNQGGWGTVKL